jgi:hypothetical protein
VQPYAGALAAFADKSSRRDPETVPVRLWVYVESPEEAVGLDLSRTQLQSIAALGASLGISVDFLGGEPSD